MGWCDLAQSGRTYAIDVSYGNRVLSRAMLEPRFPPRFEVFDLRSGNRFTDFRYPAFPRFFAEHRQLFNVMAMVRGEFDVVLHRPRPRPPTVEVMHQEQNPNFSDTLD